MIHWLFGCGREFWYISKKRVNSEGIITHYGVGYSFHLALHSRDKILLDEVQLKLNGVGTMYEHKDGTEIRIAVNDRESLLWLVANVFDQYNLLTAHQVKRYNLLKFGLLNNIKRFETLEEYNKFASMDYATENKANIVESFEKGVLNVDNWIIGFINGEGCFYHKNGKPVFCIEHTDKYGLELIKKRLAFGPSIISRSPRARDVDNPKKQTYQLFISSKKDIAALVNFLDNSGFEGLKGHKLQQYNEWKLKQ